MDKQRVIAELRRVAELLQTDHLTSQQFKQHGRVSLVTVTNTFGSWNEAVEAAGLHPTPSGPTAELKKQRYSDDELLEEIIRLTRELGKQPTVAALRGFLKSPF